ncbi:SulP family inorganic anion transporter [Alphaproteobacteria bacterium LSUCC0684]
MLKQYFPILTWGREYSSSQLTDDAIAAVIVTVMLIPQSLAYALLAGLPAHLGLYASILPLVAYAIFGTSSALAVGPVAVVSLMTAAAIGNLGLESLEEIILAATILAGLSGGMLILMGVLRLGFLANFLSHPVIAGFISASGMVIAFSQLKHLLGVEASGHNLIELIASLMAKISQINMPTALIGFTALAFLFWVRSGLKPVLTGLGMSARMAGLMTKLGPVLVIVMTILVTRVLHLDHEGVAIVGIIPQGLPGLGIPDLGSGLWMELAGSAFLISIIGFVESVSVAQTLAAKKRQRIYPDQELIGLGASNIASSLSGGYPVTGGFARSVVNFDAGAATPAAGAFSALGIAFATMFLTPFLFYLPKAALAATIIVAVLSLVDFSVLRRTWIYSKADFMAVFLTLSGTLLLGVEIGVTLGVVTSILLYLLKTARPHIAIVGQVGESEHFRNIHRHRVRIWDELLSIRVDQSLYFANARSLEDFITARLADYPDIRHVVLQCSAVNEIDASAVESLEAINEKLASMNVEFHLSEVKGPVMDRLDRINFTRHISGQVFLSQIDAVKALTRSKGKLSAGKPQKGKAVQVAEA